MFRCGTLLLAVLALSGCDGLFGPTFEHPVVQPGEWTSAFGAGRFQMEADGTYVVQLADPSDHWMFQHQSPTGSIAVYDSNGNVNEPLLERYRSIDETWHTPYHFSIEDSAILNIFVDAPAFRITERGSFSAPDPEASFPQDAITYNGTLEISVPPSGAYDSNKADDLSITSEPRYARVFMSTDGTDPVINRSLDDADTVSVADYHVGLSGIRSFDVKLRFKGAYFDAETAVIERDYSFDILELGGFPDEFLIPKGHTLIVRDSFGNASGGEVDMGSLVSEESGIVTLTKTKYHSGSFQYSVGTRDTPGTLYSNISTSGTEITIDEETLISIRIEQGSYWGPDTEYEIRADVE